LRPSLESIMLRKSVGSMEGERPTCSGCERTPLVGEFLHEIESGALLCGLCLRRLPEQERVPLSSRRVHAGERTLQVAPADARARPVHQDPPSSARAA
jgi:hypothetical protein